MSLEAIELVRTAEDDGKKLKSLAQAEAKRLLAEAENAGKAEVDDAAERAAGELKYLAAEAEKKAKAGAEQIRSAAETENSLLREKAAAHMDEAVRQIVERIVNG